MLWGLAAPCLPELSALPWAFWPRPHTGQLNEWPGSPLSQEIGFIFPARGWQLNRALPRMKLAPLAIWLPFPSPTSARITTAIY